MSQFISLVLQFPPETHIYFTTLSSIVTCYVLPLPLEKPRGGLLHQNPVLGARPPDADPVCDPQHGAAVALLQPAQSGVQQQGRQPLRSFLHPQPHKLLLPQPQGGPQTGEPESLLESSSTEHRGDGGKRLSGGTYKDVRTQRRLMGLIHN